LGSAQIEAAHKMLMKLTTGPFDVPLGQMKAKKVFLLKHWDIQPDLLDQMEITYAQVR